MSPQPGPEKIVNQMMKFDAFSKWLGIKVVEASKGISRLEMQVREEMLNGFGIVHGGIIFSLADSALAFAANGHGSHSLSIEASMSFLHPVSINEVLTAEAVEDHRSSRLGRYTINILRNSEKVAIFKGVVYITSKNWETD